MSDYAAAISPGSVSRLRQSNKTLTLKMFALLFLFGRISEMQKFAGRLQSIFSSDTEVLLAQRELGWTAIGWVRHESFAWFMIRCTNTRITAPVSARIPWMPSDHPSHPRFDSTWEKKQKKNDICRLESATEINHFLEGVAPKTTSWTGGWIFNVKNRRD